MSCASSGFGSSRASSQTESAGRGSACHGCAGQKGTNVHGCEWIPMDVHGFAWLWIQHLKTVDISWHYPTAPYNIYHSIIDIYDFFWGRFLWSRSLQRVTGRREQLQSDSQPLTIFNPTWLLKMDQNGVNQGQKHTLPHWYRMVLAWFPSQSSLGLLVSFLSLLLRLICLVNSIPHMDANTCNIKDSIR